MKFEIVDKIDAFFKKHDTFTEECHVVYLMVEIRKILDQMNSSEYQLIRFYCDWIVHTSKDRNTHVINDMMEELYSAIESQIKNQYKVEKGTASTKFAYMDKLKDQMKLFIDDMNISTNILQDDNWIQFVIFLVKVLENQPIINPTENIKTCSFLPAAENCVWYEVVFNEPINGEPSFKYGNAY